MIGKLQRHNGYWTFDPHGPAYYFWPVSRSGGAYRIQRRVEAIIDIASDGSLVGVELASGDLPAPPPESRRKHSPSQIAAIVADRGKLSAAQASAKHGITRNAVIGIWHRYDLPLAKSSGAAK